MATKKKSLKASPQASMNQRNSESRTVPLDPRLFSRALLEAQDARAAERLTKDYMAAGRRAYAPGKVNPVADTYYKLKDRIGLAGAGAWNQFVSVAAKLLQLRSYEYYPYDEVPNAPVYFWSTVKAYDGDPFTHQELLTAVGPPPGNPDNEISVKSGYAAFHPANGDGAMQSVLLNGRSVLAYGPSITIDTTGASSVYISCSVNLAYLFTFDASGNPRFDPARYLYTCFMSGALWLGNLYDVWNKTTGIGYGSSTLQQRIVRSVAVFPEGITAPTGQAANPEIHFGLGQQFSDDVTITYNANLNLPANARCQFQLALWSDVTAVGPRNGRWNRFICNSQLSLASASFPRIDVDVWPLV